ncbi:MAG TPA: ABC transporter permease [Chlamydiales bacterium]|nr:ABC transporter permease [Chlamydiales bacterium]
MRNKRLFALIKKEGLQIVRDPSAILIALVLPILLLFLYGTGVSLDLNHLRIGLVMEESSPDAQSLAKSFVDSPYFDVKIVRDRRELLDDLQRGRIRGFVVIPSYFSEFRKLASTQAPIQVIADGSEANTANFVQYYALGAFQNWLRQEAISSDLSGLPLIHTETRFWYNDALESRYFLLSGSLAIIMTLIGTLLTGLVVSREWERGTMESLISTPVGKWEIVAGKTIPYFFLGMFSMAICLFVSTCLYNLPFRGSLLALFFLSACFLICALGIGLLISILSKIQTIASQIALMIGFLPAYILSGFLFEISSMPSWIQYLTHFMPFCYFVQSLQTLFLVGTVQPLFWKNIFILLTMIVFLFFMISKKLKKSLD